MQLLKLLCNMKKNMFTAKSCTPKFWIYLFNSWVFDFYNIFLYEVLVGVQPSSGTSENHYSKMYLKSIYECFKFN